MPEPLLQYPCPACVGVLMSKLRLGAASATAVVDHCRRCGGLWLQAGEVQQLRRLEPGELREFIARGVPVAVPVCHGCHAPLPRDADACAACGTQNELECPECAQPMERETVDGVRLDFCRDCRGVWFDHHETDAIWKLELEAAVQRRRVADPSQSALTALDVLVLTDLGANAAVGLASAGGSVAEAAAAAAAATGPVSDAAAAAADAATAAAEVAGEAAAGVFETVLVIVGGIFS
jgi:Zn-finger nucleic acid-binding protein